MDDIEKLRTMSEQAEGMAVKIAELKKKIEEWEKERQSRQNTPAMPLPKR